jgi:hypothetical protein
VRLCHQFCEWFGWTGSVLSRSVENLRMPQAPGCAPWTTREMRAGVIRFTNGSRILAFSSNPNALRAFGGDVGLDEFAFHPEAEAL